MLGYNRRTRLVQYTQLRKVLLTAWSRLRQTYRLQQHHSSTITKSRPARTTHVSTCKSDHIHMHRRHALSSRQDHTRWHTPFLFFHTYRQSESTINHVLHANEWIDRGTKTNR